MNPLGKNRSDQRSIEIVAYIMMRASVCCYVSWFRLCEDILPSRAAWCGVMRGSRRHGAGRLCPLPEIVY
eukprot:scaffold14122_cov421-Alexandrium_tamarense.AAC.3